MARFPEMEERVLLVVQAAGDIGICPDFGGPFKDAAESLVNQRVLYRIRESGPDEDDDMGNGGGYAVCSEYVKLVKEMFDESGLKHHEAAALCLPPDHH
jgi:hypothetical protein